MTFSRSKSPRATGLLVALLVLGSRCGGSTTPAGGTDASIDETSASGSGGGVSSGTSSGASSGGPSGSGGNSGGTSGSSTAGSGGPEGGSGSSSGASGSSGAASAGSGSSGSSSGADCDAGCGGGPCCGGQCVNLVNDPRNCGGCGVLCSGATPFCENSCRAVPCYEDAGSCAGGSCCGTQCCNSSQICCLIDHNFLIPECYTPPTEQPSCPVGCPTCVSDRNLKRDFESVDEQAVLEALVRMSVSTWSYKSDKASVRHMGPMAQDFEAAFGLGDTDKAYNAIDAHGVTFAAIQALYRRMEEQSARMDRLEHENERLRAQCR